MKTIFDRETIRNNCEEFFSLYSVTKNRTFDMCKVKIIHTRHVTENCDKITESMGLDEYDRDIAWIIGELHDFARFGQAVVTKTFRDSERFNHARLGARILFTHRMIEDIIPNYSEVPDEDKLVMEKAVYYHSDMTLPDGLTERERMFCDIIRDADKIDIFRSVEEGNIFTLYACTWEDIISSDISPAVEEAFYRHETVLNSNRITPADKRCAHIALCFGLNSETAKEVVIEQGYLKKLMEIEFVKPEVQEKYKRMKSEVLAFLDV